VVEKGQRVVAQEEDDEVVVERNEIEGVAEEERNPTQINY
jgi:hypothetical protein